MTVLSLVPETHELLNQELPNFDFPADVNVAEVAHNLAETMFHYRGLGLSANQVGLPYRMFVMRTAPELTVCINPRLVDVSDQVVMLEEGCLSWPGLHVKIKRAAHVKVRFQDVSGDTHTEKFTGLTARIFQHELDHMNGVNFLDRAGPMAKDMAMRKWKKLQKVNNLKQKMGFR